MRFTMTKFAITTMVVALAGAIGVTQYDAITSAASAVTGDRTASQNRAITHNMEKLMAGQDSALSGYGHYASTVEDVPGVERDARIPVTIEVSRDGQSYVMISESQSGQYAYAVSGSPSVIWSPRDEQLITAALRKEADLTLPTGISVIPVVNH